MKKIIICFKNVLLQKINYFQLNTLYEKQKYKILDPFFGPQNSYLQKLNKFALKKPGK